MKDQAQNVVDEACKGVVDEETGQLSDELMDKSAELAKEVLSDALQGSAEEKAQEASKVMLVFVTSADWFVCTQAHTDFAGCHLTNWLGSGLRGHTEQCMMKARRTVRLFEDHTHITSIHGH